MKKRKVFSMIGFVIVLLLLVTACSKSGSNKEYGSSADNSLAYDMDGQTGVPIGTTSGEMTAVGDAAVAPDEVTNGKDGTGLNFTTTSNTDTSTVQSQEKIIRTFYMDVETQKFDNLITQISSEINRLEGYVENSKISGKRYYNNDEARYGSIVARIPSDKVDEFVSTVGENANVVNKQESTDNVSLQYIDTESRIETLKIEQERLYAILDQEVSLDNIITLESRLSDIRYNLQNYESQLRLYDNKVSYSTVTLSIQEVDKLTTVTEVKQSVGTRIKNGFSDTMYKISEGFKDFLVWFAVNLPYLLIWGIIIAVILIITFRTMKKQKARKSIHPLQDQNQSNQGPGNQG